jgi:YD repeat-containing protein
MNQRHHVRRSTRLEERRTRLKRVLATLLATVYLCGSEAPMLFTFASPGWFVRPGAGVSSLPLNVSSFGAPGFGELAQAVNLVNGNVYASAGGLSFNNRTSTSDETTNRIGGSGWNLTGRMRLNGFSKTSNANFGQDNLTVEQNLASSAYTGYRVKPNIVPVNRLERPTLDFGCNNGAVSNPGKSGVFHDESVPIGAGTYRVTLELRSDVAQPISFGLNDFKTQTVTVTPNWQSFTKDFTITTGENLGTQTKRLVQIFEQTQNNSAWDIAKLSVRKLSGTIPGANLVTETDLGKTYWSAYCARPITNVFSRLESADGGEPTTPNAPGGVASSGVNFAGGFLPGTYRVALQARTRQGNLNIEYGINDLNKVSATLTPSWQFLNHEFTVSATSNLSDSLFQLSEGTSNNPDWEVRNISVQRLSPGTFTLSSGDGSARVFKQTNLLGFSVPSWINRYGNTTGTTIYALEPQPGTQFSVEFIVLRQTPAGFIAHHYDPSGHRTTFFDDGEYADFQQNPHQQLRGATGNDPEGILSGTPKTELRYTAPNSGLIAKIKDEWGRVTTYDWNTNDKTLTRVNDLLDNEAQPSSAARSTAFEYGSCFGGQCGNARAVTKITHTAPDGRGVMVSRVTQFDYQWRDQNTRLLLRQIRKSVLNANATRDTTYEYDDANRLTRVSQTAEPDTRYTYTMTNTVFVRNPRLPIVTLTPTRTANTMTYRVPNTLTTDLYELRLTPTRDTTLEWTRNGKPASSLNLSRGRRATLGRFTVRPGDVLALRGSHGAPLELTAITAVAGPLFTSVRVTQGEDTNPNRKETTYNFDDKGHLTQRDERDFNPVAGSSVSSPTGSAATERTLTTRYTYTPTGSTASLTDPAGRVDRYTYDPSGNLTRLDTYVSADHPTPERSTLYTYDADNRRLTETIPATSGTRDGANFNYAENKKLTRYQFHVAEKNGQTFQALKQRTDERLIGNVTVRLHTEQYDQLGRLTQIRRSGAAPQDTGRTTDYTHHTGSITSEFLTPTLQGANAKQYADLIATATTTVNGTSTVLRATKYEYNRFGDTILETVENALNSDVDSSGNFAQGDTNLKNLETRTANPDASPVSRRGRTTRTESWIPAAKATRRTSRNTRTSPTPPISGESPASPKASATRTAPPSSPRTKPRPSSTTPSDASRLA